jgi:hypothetical protein
VVLRVHFLYGFLEILDFGLVIFIEFGHFRKFFLNGNNIFVGLSLLTFQEINFTIKTAHKVVMNVLVLCKDFILLEVLSESFFLLVGKEFQLLQLDLQILLYINEIFFFFSAEIELLNKIIILLLQKVLSGVEPFGLFFELGNEGFEFVGNFVLGVFFDGELLSFFLEKLKQDFLGLFFFDIEPLVEHGQVMFHFLVVFHEHRVLFLEFLFNVIDVLSAFCLNDVKLLMTLAGFFLFYDSELDILVVEKHDLSLVLSLLLFYEGLSLLFEQSDLLMAGLFFLFHFLHFVQGFVDVFELLVLVLSAKVFEGFVLFALPLFFVLLKVVEDSFSFFK